MQLVDRNTVVKGLSARGNGVANLNAAKWAEAIRILGEQIRDELDATSNKKSLTLDLLNVSVSRKPANRAKR